MNRPAGQRGGGALHQWLTGWVGRMDRAGSGLFRKAILLEAGAALLFFGTLVPHQELAQEGAVAVRELKALGYKTPISSDPVRIYPARTGQTFDSAHAGGWNPGVIALREAPTGVLGPEVYLRHELMHEVSSRTCAGRLPLWAEEAAAIRFSGELKAEPQSGAPAAIEVDHLRKRVRIGASFDPAAYRTLAKLVANSGWPSEPCAISQEMAQLLRTDAAAPDFSYILISILSGEILDAKGDLKTRYPPGSLLKIPYVASLTTAANETVSEELAASDTARLLKRKSAFAPAQFRLLTSMVKDTPLGRNIAIQGLPEQDEQLWRQYLGERDRDGTFPFEANLQELSLVLRAALLDKPERFAGLSQNGLLPGSTLFGASEPDKGMLKRLHAMSKTGTVSDVRGMPLVGHLMVAWPHEDPVFLAVFRLLGSNGASSIRRASAMLQEWSARYPPAYGRVRVRLLTLTPRSSWEILDECPSWERQEPDGGSVRVSTCGRFKILSSARGSRSERFVSGLLQRSPDGNEVILQTDPETYADAVLSAEAQDLQGEAQQALRAAIVWNGVHGSHRHPASLSLCDSTHCMVFQGQGSEGDGKTRGKPGLPLLGLLDELAMQKQLNWLPFSEGGVKRWERRFSFHELKQLVAEPEILDLRRERTRSGEIMVHLLYPEGEERVPCETFRSKLKLPSCPESIQGDTIHSTWIFQGIGQGHGQGLSVDKARTLAKSGASASAILKDAYQ